MRRFPLRLAGALLAPAVLVSFVLGVVACGAFNLLPQRAQAQTLSAPTESPFAAAAEKALPAVVNISGEKTVQVSGRRGLSDPGGPFGELFRDFFRGFPELPFEIPQNALGSGVIIRSDGYIVTNSHVVNGYDRIAVKLADGTEFKGDKVRVVGIDQQTDLAVLKVSADRPLPVIPFADPQKVRVGDWAIAVGNPFGLQGTVTVGVISAKGRSGIPLPEGPSRQDFIQTDAAINPGNSGGALINTAGELLGINTAIRSPVGANVGIGFAVPADLVRSVADQLIEHGRVVRGYLGIRPQEVTASIRRAMKLGDSTGVLVSEVLAGTPAEKAGVRVGDVVVEVNGVRVSGVERFRRDIAELRPGTKVKLTLVRNGRKLQLEAKLAEFNEEARTSVPQAEPQAARLGLSVRDLTAEERQQFAASGGVVVENVERGRPAAEAGIQRGDVILRVGDLDIGSEADFARAARQLAENKDPVLFYLKRDGRPLFLAVEPD